jgi:uncharacterized protein YcaQ
MFLIGDLVSGGRRSFKRLYALPEQILPQHLLDAKPDPETAKKQLVMQAATAFGVATYTDLADWHRMKPTPNKHLVDELVDSKQLIEVKVEGWQKIAYLPTSVSAKLDPVDNAKSRTTILSPFDPVCWNRDRIERMFGFEYRIEIYTPEPKRQFGYYTLPILHNNNLVGRIDLKSERKQKQLLVQASWHEESLARAEVRALASELNAHLKVVRNWQGLNETLIAPKGNLASLLKS